MEYNMEGGATSCCAVTTCKACGYLAASGNQCCAVAGGKEFDPEFDPATQWPRWCPLIADYLRPQFADWGCYSGTEIIDILEDMLPKLLQNVY